MQQQGSEVTLKNPRAVMRIRLTVRQIFDHTESERKEENMTGKDLVIAWLNDAHGMENALVQILEHQIKDAKDYPQVQAKLQQHLEQTRRHAELVKGCVENLGGKTSTMKTGMATLFGQMQALSTGAAKDEMVKNALADYAAENFEVASYTALVRAAQELGDLQTARVCQQILQEDEEMALWLRQNLPTLVQQTLLQLTA
ncbi:MAG: ferritin-like domain-containing protein [Chloroflexi bacterium]|nr:MAG: ferritin-like domain-containing protein [Chloroflexota bacterium]